MTFFSPPNRDNIAQKPNMDKTQRRGGQNNEASAIWQTWFNRLQRELNYKSYCFVHKNANDQAILANTETLLTWTTADYDTQSEVDLSNEKWTCKKDGVYDIECHATFAVTADADRLTLRLYKNNTLTIISYRTASSIYDETLVIKCKLYLEVDDYIEFKVRNENNNDTIRGATTSTFFSIYRLGD